MDQVRVDAQGVGAAGLFGARAEAELPMHAPVHGALAGEPTPARRSLSSLALRIVRDALIAALLMATVPVGIVARNGDRVWNGTGFSNNQKARIAQAEAARPLALLADPTITPMQAGLAFNALQPKVDARRFPKFEMIEPAVRPEATWEKAVLTPEMFPSAQPTFSKTPNSQAILESVAKGVTPQEMAYLRTLATAPVWPYFDRVARAPAVDFVGGHFKVPFDPGVNHYELPLFQHKGTKELAYAAVSRAAYHMAIGQRDSAETILRSIVSVGFALIDNGTSLIDELIGNVIVGIGRDGLQRFYAVTNDPRAASAAVQQPPRIAGPAGFNMNRSAGNTDAMRRSLVAMVEDPSTRRGERYHALEALTMSSCTTVGQLLFGRSADVEAAIDRARRTLARYPSERALVDLVDRPIEPGSSGAQFADLSVSAATVAGAVLHNSRFATCARVAGSVYRGR